MGRFRLCTAVGLLIVAAAVVFPGILPRVSRGTDPRQEKKPSSPEDQRKAIDVAREFAKAVASPDSPEYYRVLQQSLLTLKQREYATDAAPVGRAVDAQPDAKPDFAILRDKLRNETADLTSLNRDETWRANFNKWLNQSVLPQEQPLRIIGGVMTEAGEFPDCVAVGSSGGFCCSGTLISKDLVVTAAHCVRGGCADRIYIGNNSNQPGTGRVIKVKKAIEHPEYNRFTSRNDIALLVLDQPVADIPPRKIAASAAIDAAFFVRLVGFGITEFGPFGIQFKVDAVIASPGCDSAEAQDKFGCNAANELVAGGNGVDSCNGDSGGPAYVLVNNELQLAGATSRATKNFTRPCGDGGIYTRVDRYLDWIKQTAQTEGATFE